MLKKLLIALLICTNFLNLLNVSSFAAENHLWREFFVSPQGDDNGDGSESAPFRTIERAQQAVREINGNMQGDIVVNVSSGVYHLKDTLKFTNEDSATNGFRITYRGHDMPILSGGELVSGFVKSDIGENIWQAKVDAEQVRELYVNEKKCYMASAERLVQAIDWYRDDSTIYDTDGIYVSKKDFGIYQNPKDIELQWTMEWITAICHVEEILPDSKNADRLIVRMQQSWWDFQTQRGGLGPSPNRGFEVKNVLELLDNPGEFYYDKTKKLLYYMPRSDEDMTVATVIVPKHEKLIRFTGKDIYNRVQNISIEGFKLAHATWYAPGEGDVMTNQAQSFQLTNDVPVYVPGAVELNCTDSVHFKNNYFFGFGSVGLDLKNAVSNSVVDGNAFSDIADAAIVVGRDWHRSRQVADDGISGVSSVKEGPVNLICGDGVKVATSYFGRPSHYMGSLIGAEVSGTSVIMSNAQGDIINPNMKFTNTWKNDPYAALKGEKSWVRYTFDDAYSFDKIVLGFDIDVVSAEEQSNFEVLLSNDKWFEKDVHTVSVQNSAAQRLQYYNVKSKEKYRYLMIRTLGATDFALSGVWAFTSDIKPYVRFERNKKNTISNNYITRVSDTLYSGAGINSYYCEELSIVHNEISDLPYTGISLGWGWSSEAIGSKNNRISYNAIFNTNNLLSDGGGIYTLGNLDKTEVTDNYVKGMFGGNGAYYPDEGTSNSIWKDNVCEDVLKNWHIWTGSIMNNQFLETYTIHDIINNNGSSSNKFQPVNVYTYGNPPVKAQEIMENAGLSKDYQHIKNWVYKAGMHIPDASYRLSAGSTEQAFGGINSVIQSILKKGSFGSMPGQYPAKFKYLLPEVSARFRTATGADKIGYFIQLRNLLNEAAASTHSLSFAELLQLSEDALDSAKTYTDKPVQNAYPKAAYDSFAEAVALAKSGKDDCSALLTLEQAYREFEFSKVNLDLDSVYLHGASEVTEDKDTLTVTAVFPKSVDLSNVELHITPYGSAQLGDSFTIADLTKPLAVPVYHESLDKYAIWTLVAKTMEENGQWHTKAMEDNKIITLPNGNVQLTASNLAYTCEMPAYEYNISFVPHSNSLQKGFSVLFGIENTKAFTMENDHFEVEFDDTTATLYMIKDNKKTSLGSASVPLQYNQKNDMSIALRSKGGSTIVKLAIDGETVFHSLISGMRASAGFGFYNSKASIEIIKYN